MADVNFEAQVSNWVAETEQRMTAVFRESAQRTVAIAQELAPYDTGFLRGSVRVSTQAMPPINPEKGTGSLPFGEGNVTATIAGAQLGDTLFVGFTANYAVYQEYGTKFMRPQPFVGPAVARWQATVRRVSSELRARVRART